MKMPSIVEMLKAGVHFGHQTSRRHPKMAPFLFTARNGVHVFDLEETQKELQKTLNHIKDLAANGKTILFLGTKRQSQEIVREAAKDCGMPYLVERWIGGLLTNFAEVKKRLRRYNELKEEFASGEVERYTKREGLSLKKKMEKMEKYLVGLVGMTKLPDAMYIASLHGEKTAVTEALRLNLEIIGVCDTNTNPTKADYIIPANDDGVNSIRIITELVRDAVKEGNAEYEKKKTSASAPAPVQKKEIKK